MIELSPVAVVVPVYNGSRTIEACLESLLAQDYPRDRVEIVVVDNASTDGTPGLLSKFEGRIRVLFERKRGPAAARNRGVRETSAEWIAFLDADCTADPGWLRHLVEPLKRSQVGISGGRILSRRPCNRIEKFGEKIHDHQKAIEVYRPPYAISMNWASPRNVLLEAGLFDETFLRCEDVDLSMRITDLGHEFVYQADAITYHCNERTLAGLFREGFQHGLWAVRLIKAHHESIQTLRRRRINLASYKAIGVNYMQAAFGEDRQEALCQAVFDSGKKAGRLAGAVRFRYIDL